METEFSERVRFADFAAREAVRLNTPLPAFRKPERAIYEAPEGWRNWGEFTRYGEDADV
jgi:hypothetical protein